MGCEPAPKGSSTSEDPDKISVAFITNLPASFWDVAEKGTQAAGKEFDVNVEVFMPTDAVAGQKRIVEDLLIKEIDGIAISVIDAEGQMDLLDTAAEGTNLITHDSDAPNSKRLCYVGMDNYDAGYICGEVVREALPGGGKIMLFIGIVDQDNARLRRQGTIDAILGREPDSTRDDNQGGEITKGKYTILDTRVDGGDFNKAKTNASDAITKYPELNCMVGLFAYNPPMCLEAVKEADKVGQIKIVAFDEDDTTLQGIVDGEIYATVVQNPYMYGYESVRILAALARGEDLTDVMKASDGTVMIKQNTILFPARIIKKNPDADNKLEVEVGEYWSRLKELTK
ncbi:MAG: sugar-binding protein [Planctomycetaceae bacterium]|nr:sugar-binding protein [Planctomycetaceae bacterium]